MKNSCHISKLVIIGAGRVGTSFAYAMMIRKIVPEIVLIDIDKKKVKGECMDLNHGLAYAETMKIYAGDYKDCAGADYIVITSGASQQPGQSRLDLAKQNVAILKKIVPQILKYNKTAKFIIVSNPVDILTYVTLKISKLPKSQVFGSGTTLDTSRFRFLLGKHFKVSPESIDAFIIGEHGDSEVPVFSKTQIGGVPLKKMKGYSAKKMKQIYEDTKNAAYEVIKYKGSTHYAIGLVLTEIIEAIEMNQNKVMPVSTYISDDFGVKNVVLSVPCLIGKNGVEEILKIELDAQEKEALKKSAKKLTDTMKGLGI